MTKFEFEMMIVNALWDEGIIDDKTPANAAKIVKVFSKKIVETLAEGDEIAIEGLGKFKPGWTKPRRMFSGLTKQWVDIPKRFHVKFKEFRRQRNNRCNISQDDQKKPIDIEAMGTQLIKDFLRQI